MDKKQVQKILQGIFLFIFGMFEIILLIRILLKFIGASSESSFVKFWYGFSNVIFSPFKDTIPDLGSDRIVFELNSIISMIIYAIIGFFIVKIIHGFFKEKFNEKLRSLIDSGFKITEVILGLRLIFKLLGASSSLFISILYGVSSPFYEPFKGILPTLTTGNLVFETSTFIAVVIFIILDFLSDKLLTEIFKEDGGPVPTAPTGPAGPTQSPQVSQTPTQQPSTINVNIPQAAQPTQPTTPEQQQAQPSQYPPKADQPLAGSPQPMANEPLQPAKTDGMQSGSQAAGQSRPTKSTLE